MKPGDLIFYNGNMFATAKCGFSVGPNEGFNVAVMGAPSVTWQPDMPDALDIHQMSFSPVWEMNGIWKLDLYGPVTVEDALRSGWMQEYDGKPSASPAGMVVALDLVLAEFGEDDRGYLTSKLRTMRDWFAHRAKRGAE